MTRKCSSRSWETFGPSQQIYFNGSFALKELIETLQINSIQLVFSWISFHSQVTFGTH